jgi:hypothetical protein
MIKTTGFRIADLSLLASLSVVLLGGSVEPAYAYLDPGTGSMLLQLVLGGLAGLLVVIRLYWGKVKALFAVKDAKQQAEAGESGQDPAP